MSGRWPAVTLALLVGMGAVMALQHAPGQTPQTDAWVRAWGVGRDAPWHLLWAPFAHSSWAHFSTNWLWLGVIGAVVEYILGRRRAVVVLVGGAYVAIAVALAHHLLVGLDQQIMGISGALYAGVGAAFSLAYSRLSKVNRRERQVLRGVLVAGVAGVAFQLGVAIAATPLQGGFIHWVGLAWGIAVLWGAE